MGGPHCDSSCRESSQSRAPLAGRERKQDEPRSLAGAVPVANWGAFLVACAGIDGQLASDMQLVDAARRWLEYRDDEVRRFLRDLETLGMKAMVSAVPDGKPRERAAWARFLAWLVSAGIACAAEGDDLHLEGWRGLLLPGITRLSDQHGDEQVCVICGFNVFRSVMDAIGWLDQNAWTTCLSDTGATSSTSIVTEDMEDPKRSDVEVVEPSITRGHHHPAGKWPSSPSVAVQKQKQLSGASATSKLTLRSRMDTGELLRWLHLPLDAVAEEVGRHPSGYADEEEVVDTELLRRIQELFDGTFQDRSDSDRSAHKPRQLEVVKVVKIDNRGVRCDYLRRREEIRASSLAIDPIETRTDCLDVSGIIEELDATVNEKVMFHGTAADIAKAILFTRVRVPESAKDSSHGRLYGAGAYFAESVTKADQYVKADVDGLFPLVINRVLLGRVKTVTEALPNAERLADGWAAGEYDSICGDRTDLEARWAKYREFVTYNASQSMPEYLVWYRRIESGAAFESERSHRSRDPGSPAAITGSRRLTATTESRAGSPFSQDPRRLRGRSPLRKTTAAVTPADRRRRPSSSAMEGSPLERLASKKEAAGASTPSKLRSQPQSPTSLGSNTPSSDAQKGSGASRKQSPWRGP